MKPMHALTVLMLAVVGTVSAGELPEGFKAGEGYVDILQKGKPLVRYMLARDDSTPEAAHATYKVYHHVVAPDGKSTLTKGPGGRFTHHRGIYIGWSKLKHDGKSHDTWHMKKSVQLHKKFIANEANDKQSRSVSLVHWVGDHGKVVVEETREVVVHHVDDAYLLLDFTSTLAATNGDVELRGDPEHAGFQYRPLNEVAENKSAKYTFHEEGVTAKGSKDLPWVANTHKIAGDTWTVQHMNHPSNPRGYVYSAYRDYGRFGSFFQQNISNGESLTLKYRIRITKGGADRAALAEAYSTFLGK